MADRKKIAEQANKLIGEAEEDKRLHEIWHRDGYRHALPWRKRPGDNSQTQPIHDQDELFDNTAVDTLSDFAADCQNDFTPAETEWVKLEPSQELTGAQKAQITPQIAAYQTAVFSEIGRGNFHEASQESYPDLGLGTCAMCIQDLEPNEPIHNQAISITDLLIVRGAYGGLDFKGRRHRPKYSELPYLYSTAEWSPEIRGKIEKGDGTRVNVVESFWRLRDVPGTERWQYALMVDKVCAQDFIYEGAGSCAVIAARWKTDSTTAWGIGSLYHALPTIKTLDQLCYLILKHLNKSVDPAMAYDDDGVTNFDNGLVPGTTIPRSPGSKIDILESETDFDPAFFERASMKEDIRRALFQDKPDQQGKTPPTASQWIDEGLRNDRRKGAPIGRIRTEWQWAIFQRYAYLLEKRGILPKVELNGKLIRLRPQSPLIRSQKQEEVLTADKLLEIIGMRFGPQAVQILVKMLGTARAMKEGLGDKLVQFNSEDEVAKIMATMAQVAQQGAMG